MYHRSDYYRLYVKKKHDPRKLTRGKIGLLTIAAGVFMLYVFALVVQLIVINVPNSILTTKISEKKTVKNKYEVFGFAPHWTFDRLDSIDFSVLTTLAYFGVEVGPDGSINTDNRGYHVYLSDEATDLFQRAHDNGTRVVLTITQMNNDNILAFMDDPQAQKRAIETTVQLVEDRGIDGVNIDYEYMGDPGVEYRNKFTRFVTDLSSKMHEANPDAYVTVSVYASAVKDPKIYDITAISDVTDGIFMMAYDFATSGSSKVIPTSPLNGYKEGKYWYDVSTAVDDFLVHMPAEKLILGLPWYGYNYPVREPGVKVNRHEGYYTYYWWRGRRYSKFHYPSAYAETYAKAYRADEPGVTRGWDEYGKVAYNAYVDESGMWRMIFLEDEQSLGLKYDFAKEKKLGGVGMWALGFEEGRTELWSLIESKFGTKLVATKLARIEN